MRAPLGKNEIGMFLSKAAEKAEIQVPGSTISSHLVRKTCISRLRDANTPENFGAQLHKRTQKHWKPTIQVSNSLHHIWNLCKYLQGQPYSPCEWMLVPKPHVAKQVMGCLGWAPLSPCSYLWGHPTNQGTKAWRNSLPLANKWTLWYRDLQFHTFLIWFDLLAFPPGWSH